jgi:hypothetical protein
LGSLVIEESETDIGEQDVVQTVGLNDANEVSDECVVNAEDGAFQRTRPPAVTFRISQLGGYSSGDSLRGYWRADAL